MSDDEIRGGYDVPVMNGWVLLPTDEEDDGIDVDAWAEADVRSRLDHEEIADISMSVATLADAVDNALAVRSGIFFAQVFHPEPTEPTLAELHTFGQLHRDEPVSIEEARVLMAQPGDHYVTECVVEDRLLPTGPAVRSQVLMHNPHGAVMEVVRYVIVPPGRSGWVFLAAQWTDLVLGEDLAARVDEVAVRIVIRDHFSWEEPA